MSESVENEETAQQRDYGALQQSQQQPLIPIGHTAADQTQPPPPTRKISRLDALNTQATAGLSNRARILGVPQVMVKPLTQDKVLSESSPDNETFDDDDDAFVILSHEDSVPDSGYSRVGPTMPVRKESSPAAFPVIGSPLSPTTVPTPRKHAKTVIFARVPADIATRSPAPPPRQPQLQEPPTLPKSVVERLSHARKPKLRDIPRQFDRQISRSLDDVRVLSVHQNAAKCQEQDGGATQPHQPHLILPKANPNVAKIHLNDLGMSSQQVYVNDLVAKQQEAAKKSKVSMRNVETIDSSQTIIRLRAHHPDFAEAEFEITIAADTKTLHWQQAMAQIRRAKRIGLHLQHR